jgi:arylsulfatase A-like enzyme
MSSLVRMTVAVVALGTSVAAAATAAPRPNVLIVLADDAGWGDFSFAGNASVATPTIDSLARDGAVLKQFCVQPVCSPTRAELLTGRYHPRSGVRGVSLGQERMAPDERTLANVLHDAGYATGCFGKWHKISCRRSPDSPASCSGMKNRSMASISRFFSAVALRNKPLPQRSAIAPSWRASAVAGR